MIGPGKPAYNQQRLRLARPLSADRQGENTPFGAVSAVHIGVAMAVGCALGRALEL